MAPNDHRSEARLLVIMVMTILGSESRESGQGQGQRSCKESLVPRVSVHAMSVGYAEYPLLPVQHNNTTTLPVWSHRCLAAFMPSIGV